MAEELNRDPFQQAYDDITFFVDGMVSEYKLVPEILNMMKQGNANIELKKRYLLRAIDEDWVRIVEDSIPSLDHCIRNPSKYIEEIEEVVPIELSRNLSPKSIQHLATHTNLISKIEGDDITPSKILNVYREETLQTYENKFVNTLINRLYLFVNKRYEIARREGEDEQTTSLDFSEDFVHGNVKGKMHFRMEISEDSSSSDDRAGRNYFQSSDLFRRVKKLNDIITTYMHSTFCTDMGNSYIHPPVMHTNAIMKNKDLHQCLELWQFIESYESAGYSMLIQEDLKDVDREYVKELYSTLALQYLIFRYNIHSTFGSDETLASMTTETELSPHIKDTLEELSEKEFEISIPEKKVPIPSVARYGVLTPQDKMMLDAIDIALEADAQANDITFSHIPLQSERTTLSPAEEMLEEKEKQRQQEEQAETEELAAENETAAAAEPAAETVIAAETADETIETEVDANDGNGTEAEESALSEEDIDNYLQHFAGRHPGHRNRARYDRKVAGKTSLPIRVRGHVGPYGQYGRRDTGEVLHPRRKGYRRRG